MEHLYKYLALGAAFLFVVVIKSSPLEAQTSFILAVLIIFAIIYITLQRRNQSFNMLFSGTAVEIFFISSIILFMIELTGGPTSPLYFLNYFLLFGLPLISTPLISLIFSGLMILFYIPEVIKDPNIDIFLKLGSILLLLPLAYFLAKEITKRQTPSPSQRGTAKHIEETAESLENDIDDPQQREKLDDIIESAEKIEQEKS